MASVPFDQLDGHIWMNGEFVKWADAKVHVLTHGLHYASAVFEGERQRSPLGSRVQFALAAVAHALDLDDVSGVDQLLPVSYTHLTLPTSDLV